MKFFLKSKLKQLSHRLGYNIVKISKDEMAIHYPYLKQYQIGPHSFDFWIANERGRYWYDRNGFTNSTEALTLIDMTQKGDRILEIGCHHGFHSMLLSQCVGPDGFVLALEAEPQNALIAQSQIALNKLTGQCLVCHAAGADQPGTLNIATADGSNGYIQYQKEAQTTSVKAVTGDQLQEEYGPFDLIKIDVEGFEENVLKGCENILATRPKLALECHPLRMQNYGSKVKDLFDLITVHEYHGTMITHPNFDELVPFHPDKLTGPQNVNIFLQPI